MQMEKQWFNKTVEEVENELGTNLENGLTTSKFEERKKERFITKKIFGTI